MNKFILVSIFCVSIFLHTISCSVPFILNPGCDQPECSDPTQSALFYANNIVEDNKIHIIYSTFGDLTISIFQTSKMCNPIFNYRALFDGNYTNAIHFDQTTPSNSFSIIIRRVIQFNDSNDTGIINTDDAIQSYMLSDIETDNITVANNNTDQPTFQFPLHMINGSLNVSLIYSGDEMRESKFPRLKTTPKSFFLNMVFQANNYSWTNARFAFEFYLMIRGSEGSKIFSSRYIDDQYTPGIFNVWQLRTLSPLYESSMLWKPVVYQSEDRSIEENTLMRIYDLQNNVTLNTTIDQGIFSSIPFWSTISSFNVSLGQSNDGFFSKANYSFIQFTIGLEHLEPDSTAKFVSVALIASLALPGLVGIIALIVILKRRCSQPASSYGAIDD